ncbi:MAG: nucleotide exchange factor GrpE [Clostridia bacterium]|nr:nucleotide exchange factor GrpE [Clostridia bacterium]
MAEEKINQEVTEEVETETVEAPEKTEVEILQEEIEQLKDKLLRHTAEFDNFKKRTAKEKEELYNMAVADTMEKLLPVKDNMERALMAEGEDSQLKEGIKMIDKQLEDVFAGIGVTAIEAVGNEFNPELHNAVMHIELEDAGENEIVEELMKGYKYKEKVIRPSMVKVAN